MVMRAARSFLREEDGATVVEYAILVSIISIAAIVIIFAIGLQVNNAFSRLHGKFEAAAGSP